MGAAVFQGADKAIVTDDNPRTEDPVLIRRAVMDGCSGALEIGDREDAIIAGLSGLGAGDALVIAGKGHEAAQTIGHEILPFDDAEVARRALMAIGGTAP
jgi:UDP-N-acetylmuramoyl-L-alanyl-D-glutamate--2,6-diaminopimelate ligase